MAFLLHNSHLRVGFCRRSMRSTWRHKTEPILSAEGRPRLAGGSQLQTGLRSAVPARRPCGRYPGNVREVLGPCVCARCMPQREQDDLDPCPPAQGGEPHKPAIPLLTKGANLGHICVADSFGHPQERGRKSGPEFWRGAGQPKSGRHRPQIARILAELGATGAL